MKKAATDDATAGDAPTAADGGTAAIHRRADTGREGEDRACRYLQARGLRLLERNYRVANGRSRRGGEIDLILRDRDDTLVFVEVRTRGRGGTGGLAAGGAAASVGARKQARLIYAAQTYLMQWPRMPPCRFDVVALDGHRVEWLKGAFDAG